MLCHKYEMSVVEVYVIDLDKHITEKGKFSLFRLTFTSL